MTGTKPRYRVRCLLRWSTITSIPSRCTAKTTVRSTFPRACATRPTGTAPPSKFPQVTRASISGSTSTASITPQPSGSTAHRSAPRAAPSFAANSIFQATSRRDTRPCSRSSSRPSHTRAIRTSTPSRTAWARTAALPPSMGPHSSPLSGGTGCPPFATAIPASGRRFICQQPVRCW